MSGLAFIKYVRAEAEGEEHAWMQTSSEVAWICRQEGGNWKTGKFVDADVLGRLGGGRKCSTGPERRITFFNVQEKEQRAQFEALAIAATRWCWCNKITQLCLVAKLKKEVLMTNHWTDEWGEWGLFKNVRNFFNYVWSDAKVGTRFYISKIELC